MSRLEAETAQRLSSFEIGPDGTLTARFLFQEDYIGFKEHFPSQKVLPAICQILSVLVMLERFKNTTVILREIIQAKFMLPVLPMQGITCTCKELTASGQDFVVNASISNELGKVSELKLKCSLN